MAITTLNLKFRQAERMTDFSDGGGRMSAVEIIDGALNNVFADRSDLDALIGRVSLRKWFFEVQTANTDTYLGAFTFLTEPAVDPLVSVCIFTTGSVTDERAQARNYVENYRVAGVRSQYTLYGDHFTGMATIQVYCRSEIPSPDIGDVLMLSIEASGFPPGNQFVQVQEVVQRTTNTFTDGAGDYQRDVLLIRLTAALGQNFQGQDPPQRITGANPPPTVVRLTQVADAARYYGCKPVLGTPASGATEIDIGDPYISIVPTSRAETPITDERAGLGSVAMVPSGAPGALTWSGSVTAGANVAVTRYLGTPYARRSLAVTVGSVALEDDGAGGIRAVDAEANPGWSGNADYQTGAVILARTTGFSGTVSIVATPAAAVLEQGYTFPRAVTANNRAITQVFQLPGFPARGTLLIDYRALGKWIRLRDNGAGQIVGNPGDGVGTVNYATGSVSVTLGALPDIDSAILVSYGVDLRVRDSSGEVTIPTPRYQQQLDNGNVVPGTLAMSWDSGGNPRTATADNDGVITGDATGVIDETAGIVWFTTSHLPDASITYAYDYVDGTVHSETFTPSVAGGQVTVTLANAPVGERSVRALWQQTAGDGQLNGRLLRPRGRRDNGSGGMGSSGLGGTIDYTDGELVLTVDGD